MNITDFEKWKLSRCIESERQYINGIDYIFCTRSDGWIAIFKITPFEYIPLIEAKDKTHALDFCNLREPAPVPMQKLVD